MSLIVGIDPGLTGAIAYVSDIPGDSRMIVRPMPTLKLTKSKKTLDVERISKFFKQRRKMIRGVFIEKVHAMPGQGVTSTFNFGMGFGILQGILAAYGIPYTLVRPTDWKRSMCKGMPKGKDVSIIVSKRLWPHVSLLPTSRCKKESDGMADAALIAEYGNRTLRGET